MDVTSIWRVFPFVFAFSTATFAQQTEPTSPIDYDYVYAEVSAGSLDEYIGVNSDVSSFSIGGYYSLNQSWLLALDYEARFIHPETTTTEIYTLLPGVVYRYNMFDSFDLLAGVKMGLLWANQTNNETDKFISKDHRFMLGGNLTARYQFSPNWSVEGSMEVRRSDTLDEEVYVLRTDYDLTERISLGGFYKHRHESTATTNEGGLSMRFYY
ncbi:outer membrane beta-barrel protein [Vibrio sp. 16]|uniref:outer membrane beta-barrel protein n=1 Tax=Vibrio sp. 16 TaxID=391586 RepID=UPI002FEF379F